jgi:hypothetical protein
MGRERAAPLVTAPARKNREDPVLCGACDGTGKSKEFKCPKCKGSFFGSSETYGMCSSQGCAFTWRRSEDVAYFKYSTKNCLFCGGTGKNMYPEDGGKIIFRSVWTFGRDAQKRSDN